jgi:hypothetical protein
MESLLGKNLRQGNTTHRRRAGRVLKGKNKKKAKNTTTMKKNDNN